MDEMKLVQEFRAVVASPDAATLARARTRMLDGVAPGPGGRGTLGLRLPGAGPKLALTGLIAAASAAAVALALAGPGGATARPGVASPAKELADKVAAAAAARPEVRAGQWVYWQEKAVGSKPDGTFQVWTTANAKQAAYVSRDGKVVMIGCHRLATGAASDCQSIGQPEVFGLVGHGGVSIWAASGKIPVSYAGLSSLPSSPLALDRYFADLPLPGWGPAPSREFEIIKELLVTYVMPPALTGELYRALGDIPGVTVNRHAVDVAGRTGIGFQMTEPGAVDELIINPETYELMGQKLVDAGTGKVLSGTAVLKSALVSGPGVLP